MANYLEFVPVKFAVARAGAVAIPFNYLYRQDELGYVLRQSRCGVLVAMTGFGGLDYPAMLDAIAPGWIEGSTAELPDLRRVVLLDTAGTGGREGVLDVAGLAELGARNPGPGRCVPGRSGCGHPGQPGRHPVHLGHHRAAQG